MDDIWGDYWADKETMDSDFYEDAPRDVNIMKKRMTLELDKGGSKGLFLGSPDLHKLKLDTPELEQMIILQAGAKTTPTPTQLFPSKVTEEQEAYARGFVDALNKLHQIKGVPKYISAASNTSVTESNVGVTVKQEKVETTNCQTSVATATGNFTARPLAKQVFLTNGLPTQVANPDFHLPVASTVDVSSLSHKEEPQTVPTLAYSPAPVSPMDLDHQEELKLQRKRERNRIAARKCRNRKLDRISQLEERIQLIRQETAKLSKQKQTLQKLICEQKEEVMQHVRQGCNVNYQKLTR